MPDQPTYLMCPPTYYEVAYEINPWMHVERKIDTQLANEQWESLYKTIISSGARIELLDPVKGLPDLVFTANAGLVRKKMFIRSRFRHEERRGEEVVFEKWFKKNDFQIKAIEKPFCYEGEGDTLWMANDFYSGFHFRTDLEAHDQVAGILKTSYFALELKDKRFYHLDTCFMPLNSQAALVFLPAFETYAQLILLENIQDPVEVPENEALRFACNAVVIDKTVIMPSGCPKTAGALEKKGFRVHNLDLSEFIKAGGAAKCLALKLN